MSLVKEGENMAYICDWRCEKKTQENIELKTWPLNSKFGFEKFVHTKTVKERRGGKREVFRHTQHCFE
jgi:hypothetical protein